MAEPLAYSRAVNAVKIACSATAAEELSPVERLSRFARLLEMGGVSHLVDALPLLLNLKGKPYTLVDHFPFEEIFRFNMPAELLFMTARQVSKSTSTAADSVVKCNSIPNFTKLHMTPLYEQIRRYSTMFVSPFIDQSPVKRLMADTSTVNSVLHRSFRNHSKLLFSFALLNADRIRGISADMMAIDEVQDMNYEHIPIIAETMSASPWALHQYTGTPKTRDNTIQGLWDESTQCEWFIPCFHCTTNGTPTWNIPCSEYHVDKMIGPWREDIGHTKPATICYKCAKPISPRFGHWKPRKPEFLGLRHGYHVPQIIMPLHYADKDKWATLLAKRAGRGNTPVNVFHNEVLGESYDTSSKLVTLTEIDAVSRLGPNLVAHARRCLGRYRYRVLAVDWGGGGEKGVSFTAVALIGQRFDGQLECIYGKRLLTPHDHIREAADVKALYDIFRPHMLAHDYTGAGSLRETFLIQSGVPLHTVFPAMYVRSATQSPCYHIQATDQHPREHYRVDKSRTLLLTCAMIRTGRLSFFNKDYSSKEDPGLIRDFLALTEEKTQTMAAGEMYKIGKQTGFTDDFAQAVNIGCTAIWYRTNSWPNVAELGNYILSQADAELLDPAHLDWTPPQQGEPGFTGDN